MSVDEFMVLNRAWSTLTGVSLSCPKLKATNSVCNTARPAK